MRDVGEINLITQNNKFLMDQIPMTVLGTWFSELALQIPAS